MLDLLILRTLERSIDPHGFQVAEAIPAASAEVLQMEEGSLYPALHPMLRKGWISGKWGRTSENRRARYDRLTRSVQRRQPSSGLNPNRSPKASARAGE